MDVKVNRANSMTEAERRFMVIPPWIVAGFCSKCGNPVEVRVYGLLAEFQEIKLVCEECNDNRSE